MGTDNLFHKRKKDLSDFKRKTENRGKPKDRILIVCEGTSTEPNYFKSFRITSADVITEGTGTNTISLINLAISLVNIAIQEEKPYDQVWCVFDRDSHPQENYNNAITLAKNENINVAYSNEAFELWYILHFNYVDSAISRNSYSKMLDNLLAKKYTKNSKEMYYLLEDKQNIAIRNAKRLLASYPYHDPHNHNPCTTVFLLVEELNKYL